MPETPDATAEDIAAHILRGFRSYRTHFDALTRAAQERFEAAGWRAIQEAGALRLGLYKKYLAELEDRLRLSRDTDWPAVKQAYMRQIQSLADGALAETFYNSTYRHVCNDPDVDDTNMFVTSCMPAPLTAQATGLINVYHPNNDIVAMVRRILNDIGFTRRWQDMERDIRNILRSLAEERPELQATDELRVEVIDNVFFRNKCALVVGKLIHEDRSWPIALPLLLDDQGQIYVDTLICDADELSVLFSFTRAYFMVRLPHPIALVDYLQDMLPNKKRSELLASVGLHKQGKTELYRGFLEHLERSDDEFIIAPGIKGMVMTVFTLPSYQTVFKIIKDRFAPQKNITEAEVREKYNIVKRHDRAGRMADTQEFKNFVFPLHRFSGELIDELLAVAPSKIRIERDTIVISHLYTERHMIPLNMFVDDADESELVEALEEYGNAIKQLAAANIFPGDMLLKNFGITRHGRVVFYDYDEISYLTDMNFRAIPEPRTPEEEMSSETWYSVAPEDVFPEEFRRFLFGKKPIKALFNRMHGDLFDPAYWQGLQRGLDAGEVMDVFPYRRKKRFIRQDDDVSTQAAAR